MRKRIKTTKVIASSTQSRIGRRYTSNKSTQSDVAMMSFMKNNNLKSKL